MATKAEVIDRLAAIEHERWADWQRYLHSKGWKSLPQPGSGEGPGIGLYPHDVAHWERLINTPFEQLAEHSQDADRREVLRYWPYIVDLVAEYMAGCGEPVMAEAWREDME